MAKVEKVLAALLGVTVALGSTALAESFDKPVRKRIIRLGRSQYLMPNNPSRIQLFCFYYPDFMVKELNDPGLKGTPWVTITPVTSDDQPTCRLAHSSSERFMARDGYGFEGVKGALLFLEAPDGENGGMPFRVLDVKTGKKLFEDLAGGNTPMEFVSATDEAVTLRYLRVIAGDCSIPQDGMNCWSKFRKRYGLVTEALPECTGYRHEGENEWVVGDRGLPPEKITTPSVVAYPVVVKLFPRPSMKAVPGSVKCSPIE